MSVTISVVQLDCVLGDTEANLRRMERYVATVAEQGADFVIFPELGTTGYFVGDQLEALAESIPGPSTERLGEAARRHDTYVVTGMIERTADGTLYNASVLIAPSGEVAARYRKCHLFSAEKAFFATGDEAVLVDTPHGRVALTICYDLVFPEYVRGLVLQGAQLILNSTNWITDPWQTGLGWSGEVVSRLAATRALENGVHVAMADRAGVEEGWTSLGHSCVCAPSGGFVARIENGEGLATATVDLEHPDWDKWREIATYLPDRRTDFYATLQQEEAAA